MGIPTASQDDLQTSSSMSSSWDQFNLDEMCAKKDVEYRITERVTASHAYHIRTVSTRRVAFHLSGQPVLHRDEQCEAQRRLCDGKSNFQLLTLSRRRSAVGELLLTDARNGVAYTVRKKGLMPGKGRGTLFVIPVPLEKEVRKEQAEQDEKLKEKGRKSSKSKSGGKQVTDELTNKKKKDAIEPLFSISSDMWRSSAIVTDSRTERKLAIITRPKSSSNKIIMGLDSYHVKMFAGTDIALMLMLAVSFDEHYGEYSR